MGFYNLYFRFGGREGGNWTSGYYLLNFTYLPFLPTDVILFWLYIRVFHTQMAHFRYFSFGKLLFPSLQHPCILISPHKNNTICFLAFSE